MARTYSLLSWSWNHVQRQQKKSNVRFGGSLRGGLRWCKYFWLVSWWFRMVSVGWGYFGWFQVVCCFNSYTNLTAYRRVNFLLYSWSHVFDWGRSLILFKVKQQEKDYCCLKMKIMSYTLLCSMSDKKLLLRKFIEWRVTKHKANVGVLWNIWDKQFWRRAFEKFSKTGRLFAFTGRKWTNMGRSPFRIQRDDRSVE